MTYFGRDSKTRFKFSYELEAFDRFPARFSSEYGFFGAQMESTVRRYLDGEEMSFNNPSWKHHGEFERKRGAIDGVINRHLTEFSTLDERGYLLYSGIMQGLLYAEWQRRSARILRCRRSDLDVQRLLAGNRLDHYRLLSDQKGFVLLLKTRF